jgi:hypothetical protein
MKFVNGSTVCDFMGQFYLPGSGSGFSIRIRILSPADFQPGSSSQPGSGFPARIWIPNPDPRAQWNPDLIRIRKLVIRHCLFLHTVVLFV